MLLNHSGFQILTNSEPSEESRKNSRKHRRAGRAIRRKGVYSFKMLWLRLTRRAPRAVQKHFLQNKPNSPIKSYVFSKFLPRNASFWASFTTICPGFVPKRALPLLQKVSTRVDSGFFAALGVTGGVTRSSLADETSMAASVEHVLNGATTRHLPAQELAVIQSVSVGPHPAEATAKSKIFTNPQGDKGKHLRLLVVHLEE